MDKSISELVFEYFSFHANEELRHGPVVDWVTQEWLKYHQEPPRDPWRAIRALHQKGILLKVAKGIYKYDPAAVQKYDLEDFTPEQKEEIFKRDNYTCVECGLGKRDGEEIHADHLIAKSKGGKAEIINGQTLCATHNYRKKNYGQTQTGKRMFIRLYELAKYKGDIAIVEFCKEILQVYDKHNINGHIKWKP